MVIVPVANLYTTPETTLNNNIVHQCLFNERVDIIKKQNNATYIHINSAFYVTPSDNRPQNCFWVTQEDLLELKALESEYQKIIPLDDSKKTIITIKPWSPDQKVAFSAGTRFVIDTHAQKKRGHIAIIYLDPNAHSIKTAYIPKKQCISSKWIITLSSCQKRALFIKTLKQWAHQKTNEYIPYLFGGTSFVQTLEYPFEKKSILTGIDCSGLVLRIANIAGITEYRYKNSTTIKKYCPQISSFNALQNGDLILIRGHVMIISDLQKGLIIEARGYDHGFGRVHEIPLCKVFKNIHSFKDLWDAASLKKRIIRLDHLQKERDSFTDLTFHTLC